MKLFTLFSVLFGPFNFRPFILTNRPSSYLSKSNTLSEGETVVLEVVSLTGSPTPGVQWFIKGVEGVTLVGEGMVLSITDSNPVNR